MHGKLADVEFHWCSRDEVAGVDGDVAVVIDVLRAFTVDSQVYARGARSLQIATSDEEALRLRVMIGSTGMALKDGPPVSGFDLVNSPGLIAGRDLSGSDVIQRTSSGTVGVLAARPFPQILCVSLVNATATALRLRKLAARRVVLVPTGGGGKADEDVACGDLVMAITRDEQIDVDRCRDRVERSAAANDLRAGLAAGYRGIHEDNIWLAVEVDRFSDVLAAVPSSDRAEIHRVRP